MDPDFTLNPADADALTADRLALRIDDAVFHLTGPGTIDCLQGILSNDLLRHGPQSLVWGAVLTPKGMIITDLWVRRDGADAWLMVPHEARDTVRQLLARSFPPRLTKVTDRSESTAVRWLLTPDTNALREIPAAILPAEKAPFEALLLCAGSAEEIIAQDQALEAAGWRFATPDLADARKVLAGWPTLGREIDEKTLVQEVRFDELHGVKYDKGCFTGQETVARLHFRGHANRQLRRLHLDAAPEQTDVVAGEKTVGRLASWGWLGETIIALALIRREVAIGDRVTAGGAGALIEG